MVLCAWEQEWTRRCLSEFTWLHRCWILSALALRYATATTSSKCQGHYIPTLPSQGMFCIRQLLQQPKNSSVSLCSTDCGSCHHTRGSENSVLLDLSGRSHRIFLTAIMKMEQDWMLSTRKDSWFSGQLFSTRESKQDFDTRPKNLKNP